MKYTLFICCIFITNFIYSQSSFKHANLNIYSGPIVLLNPQQIEENFKTGANAGIGIGFFHTNYIHFKVNFEYTDMNISFNKNKYLEKGIESNRGFTFISLNPEINISPIKSEIIFPYLSLGISASFGIEDGKYITVNDTGKSVQNNFVFGFRTIGQIGIGTEIKISKLLNVFLIAKYNREFLENSQPENPFNPFTTPDKNIKYFSANLGLSIKFSKEQKK